METKYNYPEMPQEFWELNNRDCPIKLPNPSQWDECINSTDDLILVRNWIKDPCYDLPKRLMPFQLAYGKAQDDILRWRMAERVRIEGLWIAQINLWVDYYERNTPNSFFDHQSTINE